MPAIPKPANKRARRNTGGPEFRSVEITPGEQPPLPDHDRPWCQETREFWASLGEAELAADFTDAEWRVLMIAALMHEEIWGAGRLTRAKEFLEFMSKFPFTPRDRQALRIQTLTGDDLERKVEKPADSLAQTQAKKNYGQLRAVKTA